MRTRIPWLICSLFILIAVYFWPPSQPPRCTFSALDVGQGDAILIQTADGQDILIDGGPSARVVQSVSRKLGPGNRELELVILTHPDSDHLRGLVSVLDRIPVRQLLVSNVESSTETYHAWQLEIAEHQTPVRTVTQGETLSIGNSTTLQALWPPADWKERGVGTATNDGSLSFKITCAGSTLVSTGDASESVEEQILQSGIDISATLLKVGHHGSRTSTDHDFLQAVHPDVAVISVGKTNRYGHPHPTVLQRLEVEGVRVFRTDQLGPIKLHSDGQGGWRE